MQVYLIAYGAWRMFIEFFRADDRGAVVLGLYPSQWQSIVFIVLGIALIVFYIIRKIPLKLPEERVGEVLEGKTLKTEVDEIEEAETEEVKTESSKSEENSSENKEKQDKVKR